MYFHAEKAVSEAVICRGFGDDTLTVTNKYLMRNGTPIIPVMGEMHYSRVPVSRWRETLEHMRDGGVDIVASYVFWIHHEEQCGVFDFEGNRDIRRFILLCHELGLQFCLRLGPWAHGECKNGGFPDWLVAECGGSLRTNDEPYAGYMRRFLAKVADQVRGLPLIGIQIENEMTTRPDYMESVRSYVESLGLHAPLITATAWGNANLPDTLLPMFGGYPEAPWEGHTHVLDPNPNYHFSRQRDDGNIGRDLLGARGTEADRFSEQFPFMTCEVGGGNQITYHRRPWFTTKDITSLVITKLGNGVNLLGYYVYAGGCNPIGATTMQESRTSGYPNDCPVISYDFHAPIGDMGQLRPWYPALGVIHTFLHSFGEILAPMELCLPDVLPRNLGDTETLRCAVRSDGKQAVLFVNNHIREQILPAHPDTQITVALSDRTVSFTLDIPADSSFFLPVGWNLCGVEIDHITAQPVSFDREQNLLTVKQIDGLEPLFVTKDGSTYALTEEICTVGALNIRLIPMPITSPSEGTPVSVVPLENKDETCSSDLLLGHLRVGDAPLPDLTRDYAVHWDKDTTFLVIRARGNLAGFYVGGTLISDHYLYGGDWVIDVRGMECQEGILRVQPFREEDCGTVYLETAFESGHVVPDVYTVNTPCIVLGERSLVNVRNG